MLGQRYLLHELRPQPVSWRDAADELGTLQPDSGWTARRVEHVVAGVRIRLSRGGVPGLTREEIGEPIGNALNDNFVRELLLSTTLVPPDLVALNDLGHTVSRRHRHGGGPQRATATTAPAA